MSKSLTDIAHDIAKLLLEKSVEPNWTFQDSAETYQNTHSKILEELKQLYETDNNDYLV